MRDRLSRARAVYRQVVALPPGTPTVPARTMRDAGGRLVIEAAVALITSGATDCAPSDRARPVVADDARPLAPTGRRDELRVTDSLLDNKYIVAGRDGVWVGIAREPALVRIDPRTSRIVARIALPAPIAQPIVLAAGGVWVSTTAELLRVSTATDSIDWQVRRAGLPSGGSFTVSGGVVWECDGPLLHRTSVASRQRLPDIPLPGCQTVVAGPDSVTAAVAPDDEARTTLVEIDAATGAVRDELRVDHGSFGNLTRAGDGRFLADTEGELWDIDLVRRTTRVVRRSGVGGAQPVAGDGAFWSTREEDQRVLRYDLATHRLTEVRAGAGVNGVAVTRGTLWATNSDAGTVLRASLRPGA